MQKLPNFMRYGTFPVLFFGGITAAGLSLEQGLPPLLVYLAVVGTASVILLVLEARYPRQDDWRALGKDYRIDCGFLAYVVGFGLLFGPLKTSLALLLGAQLSSYWPGFASLWPQTAPLFVQVILGCLIFSLCRYWFHRAMHQEGRLWEIHALHHSSTKFGFLKSIWGHPLDGLPMDLLGTLPLMCLGVNPQVLTLIAVTVALSGFLAHTSLDLRTGVLSYIFNTNEVHEVHHCNSIPGEGYNFSDITPLWDHVFGSFCLEKERIGIRSLGFVTWPKRLPKPARIRDLLLLPFHLKN